MNKITLILSIIIILSTINFSNITANKIEQTELPSYFSWRNINNTDYTTPIKNQAQCPSCEAYAIVGALETMVQYEVGYPFGCDLSEMHLFLCSGGTCKWGVRLPNCTQYLQEFGVPDEGCFPDPHRAWDTPCNISLQGWENRTVKIENWGWIEINNNVIKQALIEYGPLVICELHVQILCGIEVEFIRTDGGKLKEVM